MTKADIIGKLEAARSDVNSFKAKLRMVEEDIDLAIRDIRQLKVGDSDSSSVASERSNPRASLEWPIRNDIEATKAHLIRKTGTASITQSMNPLFYSVIQSMLEYISHLVRRLESLENPDDS